MMKIYIDSNSHCHTTNPYGIFREVETDFFDSKSETYIEGFCYEIKDGGISIYPWKPYDELDAAQRNYERQMLADYEAALAEIEKALGV